MSISKLILSLAIFVLIGCANESTNSKSNPPSIEVATPAGDAAATPAATPTPAEPPQNADGVWHYTCSKGCAGGAGSAVPCATCGATLVHNQGYHAQASGSPLISNPAASGNPTAVTPPKPAEPAQNAAGVWHFTCANGCAGGAGAAGPCSGCGGTLAHNQAYHQ